MMLQLIKWSFPAIFLFIASVHSYCNVINHPQSKKVTKYKVQMSNCDTCTTDNVNERETRGKLIENLSDPINLHDLRDENLVKIVNLVCSDIECNYLCWKCLGYTYNSKNDSFIISEKVFPKWAKKYPSPPDVIGVKRIYSDPSIDKPVRDASMDLMRSIPRDFKGGVKNLQSAGFKGYKLNELTPNKTRRAQLVNWLIYYREKLFGKTFEQLRAEREAETKVPSAIAELPSQKMFEIKRLDVDGDMD